MFGSLTGRPDSNKISRDGNSKMSANDVVLISDGIYSCGTFHGSDRMFCIEALYGKIRCVEDNQLDGEGSRGVMHVDGTAGGTLTIRSIHFYRGRFDNVGGMSIEFGAIVVVKLSFFSDCQATDTYYDGGAIMAYDGTMNLFAVSFSSNTAATNDRNDVYTYSAAITIHDTCPDGYRGAPTERESSTMPACPSSLPHQCNPSPLPLCIVTSSPQHPPLTRLTLAVKPSSDRPTRTRRGHALSA